MQLTLKEFKDEVLPLLRSQSQTAEDLVAKTRAFLKQGTEDEVPVTNENGDPVEIEQIVLVGAEPAADPEEPEAEPAEAMMRTVEAAVAKALKAHAPKRPVPEPDPQGYTVPAKARRWTGKLKAFKGEDGEKKAFAFGTFIKYVHSKGSDTAAGEWLRSNGIIPKAMGESSNIAGGAFVPEEFRPDLIRLVEEYGVFRSESNVQPMTSDVQVVPRRTSGLTAYAVGENTTITDSDVGTDNVGLTARKWATLTRIASELMDDSAIGVGDLVANEIAFAFANKEDDSGFNGDGTSTYHGIWGITVKGIDGNHTASVVQAATGNTALSTLDLDDIHAIIGNLPRFAMRNAKWYVHNVAFANTLQRLGAAQGGVTWAETAAGPQMRFLGFEVVISQVLFSTTTASTNSVWAVFGDLGMASTFGDRRTMDIQTSSERYFDQDQVAIRGTERIDIVNHDLGDTSTAGPVVICRLAAS